MRTGLFLYTVFVTLLPTSARGQLSEPKLREIVRRTISNNPDAVQRPSFTIDRYAIYYDFGGLNRPEMEPNEQAKPLAIPTDTEFVAELIRQYPWRPINRRIWDRRLSVVEEIIAKELALIKSHRGPQDQLMKMLNEYKEQTDSLLTDTISMMARREGMVIHAERCS